MVFLLIFFSHFLPQLTSFNFTFNTVTFISAVLWETSYWCISRYFDSCECASAHLDGLFLLLEELVHLDGSLLLTKSTLCHGSQLLLQWQVVRLGLLQSTKTMLSMNTQINSFLRWNLLIFADLALLFWMSFFLLDTLDLKDATSAVVPSNVPLQQFSCERTRISWPHLKGQQALRWLVKKSWPRAAACRSSSPAHSDRAAVAQRVV